MSKWVVVIDACCYCDEDVTKILGIFDNPIKAERIGKNWMKSEKRKRRFTTVSVFVKKVRDLSKS